MDRIGSHGLETDVKKGAAAGMFRAPPVFMKSLGRDGARAKSFHVINILPECFSAV